MKKEPCIRFGMRIRPKIKEKPDDSRNNSPPRARLLIARIAACAAVICVIIGNNVSTHKTQQQSASCEGACHNGPSPLAGEGQGGGWRQTQSLQPPPSPSLPRKGGGRSVLHRSAS